MATPRDHEKTDHTHPTASGRCYCGGIVAEIRGEPFWICFDHDDDCRKAVGGPINTWVGYRPGQLTFTAGEPKAFSKTPGVVRTFCPACGSSIGYSDQALPDEIYLTIGFMDAPELFRPQAHAFWSMKLPWMDCVDRLPRIDGVSRRRDPAMGDPADRMAADRTSLRGPPQRQAEATALTLDDLTVGQRFESGTHALDAAQIKSFAARFDPQRFHLDDAAARETLFGGLAASGWHTASITMKLLVGGGAPLAGGLIGAAAEIAWPRPTRPGDVLRVSSEVVAITPSRSRPDRGTVGLRSETLNQRGDVVQVLTSRLVVPRRTAPAQGTGSDGSGLSGVEKTP